MKRKCLLLLVFVLVFTVPLTAFAEQFRDVEGHWAEKSIRSMLDQGHIQGYPDDTFRPEGSISRAEFSTVVVSILELSGSGHSRGFPDVTRNHWAYNDITIAASNGIVEGYETGLFKPNGNITRAEIAAIAARALVEGKELDQIPRVGLGYKDNADIPSWSKTYVAYASDEGLLGGYLDGSFRAQRPTTRAEAVVILERLIALLLEEDENEDDTSQSSTIPRTGGSGGNNDDNDHTDGNDDNDNGNNDNGDNGDNGNNDDGNGDNGDGDKKTPIDKITDPVKDKVDKIEDKVDETVDGITDTVDDTVDEVTDIVDDTVDRGTDTVDDTVDGVTDIVDDTVDGVCSIKEILNPLSGTVRCVKDTLNTILP
ncbi:S-layer homology domain-containing protein [Caldalkalibacillus salinus]|uniref:S-layer homology domain-containing protein n=1 Tax=Caldalkalibacillus salinus TaxID=2803787 RepID=UPI001922D0F7|nr:S-layer homology domain-containing protein [Caldalkalibacillus salinus]